MRFLFLLCFVPILGFSQMRIKPTITLEKNNFIIINSEFNSSSVAKVMSDLIEINSLLIIPPKELFLIIDSPGGSVTSGLRLIDFLNAYPTKINTITLYGASMGFITSQFLNKRYITESGMMMAHNAFGGFQGEFNSKNSSQIDSRLNFWKKRIGRIENQIVSRTHGIQTVKSLIELSENEFYCEVLIV